MITNWLHEEQSTSNAVIAVSKIITRLISIPPFLSFYTTCLKTIHFTPSNTSGHRCSSSGQRQLYLGASVL
jgi:hypothetical protein